MMLILELEEKKGKKRKLIDLVGRVGYDEIQQHKLADANYGRFPLDFQMRGRCRIPYALGAIFLTTSRKFRIIVNSRHIKLLM